MATTETSTTTITEEDDILEHIRETLKFNRIHALVSVLGSCNCVHII
jgi:hypothetical protein